MKNSEKKIRNNIVKGAEIKKSIKKNKRDKKS